MPPNPLTPLRPHTTAALVIDLQQRLLPAIHHHPQLLETTIRFLKALPLFPIPTLATEQYPQGLGPTVPEIASLLPTPPRPKTLFSACTQEILADLQQLHRPQILVLGIETHVCLQQTVLDLLRNNYQPYVLTDATSSRRPHDRDTALLRMTQAGAIPTTTESALFELTQQANTDTFKQLLKIVK